MMTAYYDSVHDYGNQNNDFKAFMCCNFYAYFPDPVHSRQIEFLQRFALKREHQDLQIVSLRRLEHLIEATEILLTIEGLDDHANKKLDQNERDEEHQNKGL